MFTNINSTTDLYISRFSVVLVKLKNVGKGWDSNPDLLLAKFLSSPQCRDHLCENKTYWKKYTDGKKETTPLYMREK